MSSCITLSNLIVEGPGKIPASVSFKAGLNAIVGATGTGKSYIFQTIDFCLGAGKQPKKTKESSGYNSARLTLGIGSSLAIALDREFSGEKIILTPIQADLVSMLDGEVLSAKHSDDGKSLSNWLLNHLGLQGTKVIHNAWLECRSFSFRHVAHLAMVDENRIISEESPAVTGGSRDPNRTSDQRAFNVLITGHGDTPAEHPIIRKKDRNLSIDGKIEWMTNEIQRLQSLIEKVSDKGENIDSRLKNLDQAIEEAATVVTATKARVIALESKRQENRKELLAVSDIKEGINERLKRFIVLRQYYDTDALRIEATLEAGHAFEQLPGGQCAVCGMMANNAAEHPALQSFDEFARAAQIELAKLTRLKLDLDETISWLKLDFANCANQQQVLQAAFDEVEGELSNTLRPQAVNSALQLKELLSVRSEVVRALDANTSIERLKLERLKLEKEKTHTVSKPPKPDKVASGSIKGFCEVVTDTLRSWRFELESDVDFDENTFDLIVNGQPRSSLGKGHRALTHAAFTISTMRYCLKMGLPHPGFVVLDSPLNPFKGKTTGDGDEIRVSREVQDAFYTDLSNRPSNEQYIIIENTEVPSALLPLIHHVEFTGNAEQGRAGFFPPNIEG